MKRTLKLALRDYKFLLSKSERVHKKFPHFDEGELKYLRRLTIRKGAQLGLGFYIGNRFGEDISDINIQVFFEDDTRSGVEEVPLFCDYMPYAFAKRVELIERCIFALEHPDGIKRKGLVAKALFGEESIESINGKIKASLLRK